MARGRAALVIGERINNYTVTAGLGEGGMGAVYIAENLLIGRKVAIKVLHRKYAEDRSLVSRFINEAKAAHAIRHENIVEMLDAGTLADGRPYLVMELLSGRTLARRIEDAGRLSVAEALGYVDQVASALGAAHRRGIVHRDLKPDNVFLAEDPEEPGAVRVKVLDFGIAKLQRDLTSVSLRTNTGSLLGTPPYMSPEQCRGLSDEIDQRTDVYALGIILYEMLCGAPPFVSQGYGDLLMMHMSTPPRPPRELNDTIPPEVEAVILRALEKDRAKRFLDMAELAVALGRPAPAPSVKLPPLAAAERAASTIAPTVTDLQGSESSASGSEGARRRRSTTLSSTASQIEKRGSSVSRVLRQRWARRALIATGVAASVAVALVVALGRSGKPAAEGGGPTAAVEPRPASAPQAVAPIPAPPAPTPAVVEANPTAAAAPPGERAGSARPGPQVRRSAAGRAKAPAGASNRIAGSGPRPDERAAGGKHPDAGPAAPPGATAKPRPKIEMW
jgi:serine/threonine-protein kinase